MAAHEDSGLAGSGLATLGFRLKGEDWQVVSVLRRVRDEVVEAEQQIGVLPPEVAGLTVPLL
jgi:hypothetical protein